MVTQLVLIVALISTIVPVALLVRRRGIPLPLALVLVGVGLGWIPGVPRLQITPGIVLFLFLPLLVYQTSISVHWRDLRRNLRPIVLLSVGHVVFITFVVAWCCQKLLGLPWVLGVIIGAALAPPDDIALVSVAPELPIPRRIVTVLSGEGLFNDAMALTLLKFAIIAAATHTFSAWRSVGSFAAVVIGESLYGALLGYILTAIRRRLQDAELEVLVSLISPFLAYIPAAAAGGSGVLATAVLGFYIGQNRSRDTRPESRILGSSVWRVLALLLESLLFLWAGFNTLPMIRSLSHFSPGFLARAGIVVTLTVVAGRFLWVYPAAYLPRLLLRSVRQDDPYPPWQQPFLVAWSGMRGAISIAAALIIPTGSNGITSEQKQLIVFLTFSVVLATLIVQGLSLPWVLSLLGMSDDYRRETERHAAELARTRERIRRAGTVGEMDSKAAAPFTRESLKRERAELARVFQHGNLSTENYRRLERELDLRESSLIEPEA